MRGRFTVVHTKPGQTRSCQISPGHWQLTRAGRYIYQWEDGHWRWVMGGYYER
jgi:hypothetical protein